MDPIARFFDYQNNKSLEALSFFDIEDTDECEDAPINSLGIDVGTDGVKLLISKLEKLESVTEVQDGGRYWEDNTYSQIWLKTTMNESELDDYLYNVSLPRDIDIVGCFEKEWG
jgi:hypothetical protein